MNINRSTWIGLAFILLAFILLVTDFFDTIITTILWPLLEGSSEGKAVLLFGIIGSLFILEPIINNNQRINKIFFKKEENSWKYLVLTMILLFITAFFALLIEIHIRLSFNVSIFTILSSLDPLTSTTSLMHTHAYKSVLGHVINGVLPAHINTGSSISQYVLPYAFIIIILWPIIYFIGLLSLKNMNEFYKILSSIILTIALIGLVDGGMFSQPFLIGLGFLLLVYFSHNKIGIKYFINPVVIMGYILLAAMILEVGGSNQDGYTLTVVDQTAPIDMTDYNVTEMHIEGNNTIYEIHPSLTDKVLIKKIFHDFKDKARLTFMTWNFYTYFH